MIIDYKHEIGKTVFYLKNELVFIQVPCTVCEGHGELFTFEGHKTVECSMCHGKGTISKSKLIKKVINKDLISRIDIIILDNNEVDLQYTLENSGDDLYEEDLFETYEEAEMSIKYNN